MKSGDWDELRRLFAEGRKGNDPEIAKVSGRLAEAQRSYLRMPNAFCVSFAFPPGVDRSAAVREAFDLLLSRLITCVEGAPLELFISNIFEGEPFEPGRLGRLVGRYAMGKLDRLSAQVYPTAELALSNPRLVFPVPQWEEIRLRVSQDVWSLGFEAAEWVELLLSTAGLLGPGQGFVTHDIIPENATPYEAATRWGGALFDEFLSPYLRGYYWANVLGPTHVDTLGGLRAVLAAPFHRVVELPDGMVFIQVTESIEAFNEEALRAIREYLRPVLNPRSHARPEDRQPPYDYFDRVIYDDA